MNYFILAMRNRSVNLGSFDDIIHRHANMIVSLKIFVSWKFFKKLQIFINILDLIMLSFLEALSPSQR